MLCSTACQRRWSGLGAAPARVAGQPGHVAACLPACRPARPVLLEQYGAEQSQLSRTSRRRQAPHAWAMSARRARAVHDAMPCHARASARAGGMEAGPCTRSCGPRVPASMHACMHERARRDAVPLCWARWPCWGYVRRARMCADAERVGAAKRLLMTLPGLAYLAPPPHPTPL